MADNSPLTLHRSQLYVSAAVVLASLGDDVVGFRDAAEVQPKCSRTRGRVVGSDSGGPQQRTQGRNELCACGSGKKFKRCHGA